MRHKVSLCDHEVPLSTQAMTKQSEQHHSLVPAVGGGGFRLRVYLAPPGIPKAVQLPLLINCFIQATTYYRRRRPQFCSGAAWVLGLVRTVYHTLSIWIDAHAFLQTLPRSLAATDIKTVQT